MTSRFGFGFVFTLTAYDFEPQRSQNGGAVSIELHCRWHGLVGSVRTPIPTIGATPHRLVLITGIFRLEPFSPGQSKRAAVVMANFDFRHLPSHASKKSPRQDLGVQPSSARRTFERTEALGEAFTRPPGSRCMSQWSAVYGYNGFVSSSH